MYINLKELVSVNGLWKSLEGSGVDVNLKELVSANGLWKNLEGRGVWS